MPKRFREFERGVRASRRMRARGVAFWRNEPNEHFGQTKPSGEHARERSINPRLCDNDRRRNFLVFGLLFTMRFATHTCRPH